MHSSSLLANSRVERCCIGDLMPNVRIYCLPPSHVDPKVQGLNVIINCSQPGSSRATYTHVGGPRTTWLPGSEQLMTTAHQCRVGSSHSGCMWFFGHLARTTREEDHHCVIAAALRPPADCLAASAMLYSPSWVTLWSVLLTSMQSHAGPRHTTHSPVGPFGSGLPNDNSDRLVSFSEGTQLRVVGSWFRWKDIHRVTLFSNDGWTRKEIDHNTSQPQLSLIVTP